MHQILQQKQKDVDEDQMAAYRTQFDWIILKGQLFRAFHLPRYTVALNRTARQSVTALWWQKRLPSVQFSSTTPLCLMEKISSILDSQPSPWLSEKGLPDTHKGQLHTVEKMACEWQSWRAWIQRLRRVMAFCCCLYCTETAPVLNKCVFMELITEESCFSFVSQFLVRVASSQTYFNTSHTLFLPLDSVQFSSLCG